MKIEPWSCIRSFSIPSAEGVPKTGNLLVLNFGPVSREVKTGRMAADMTVYTGLTGIQWWVVYWVFDVFLGRSMTVFTLNISKLRCELIAEKSFLLKPNNMTLQAFRIEVLTDPCKSG